MEMETFLSSHIAGQLLALNKPHTHKTSDREDIFSKRLKVNKFIKNNKIKEKKIKQIITK